MASLRSFNDGRIAAAFAIAAKLSKLVPASGLILLACASAAYEAHNFSVASCLAAWASRCNRLCSRSARVALIACHVLTAAPIMRDREIAATDNVATRLRLMNLRSR